MPESAEISYRKKIESDRHLQMHADALWWHVISLIKINSCMKSCFTSVKTTTQPVLFCKNVSSFGICTRKQKSCLFHAEWSQKEVWDTAASWVFGTHKRAAYRKSRRKPVFYWLPGYFVFDIFYYWFLFVSSINLIDVTCLLII